MESQLVRKNLKDEFRKADLPVKVCGTPEDFSSRIISQGSQESFLMDIRTQKGGKNERNEVFYLYPGKGNDVKILDTNKKLQQAILRVEEPDRVLVTKQHIWDKDVRKYRVENVEQQIVGGEKWFLVGMDEMHLFVAQLDRPASSVSEAHGNLRPKTLKNKSHAAFKRQGEWFFTPADRKTLVRLDSLSETEIHRNVGLGRAYARLAGRPHIVDESAILDGIEYARGSVKHPDHKTKTLSNWHRVTKNTEQAAPEIKGLKWID